MELLISGATVFSLLQAPGLMDDLYYSVTPGLASEYRALATLPYLYLMTACLALIATFLMHLCVRGYWVALVGLGSVYPEGVNWSRLRWGPGFVQALRERTPPLADAIERYDNRASQVFGFGMGLSFLAIGITLAVLALGLATVAIYELSGHAAALDTILFALMALGFGPYLLLYFTDGLMRTKPDRHPRLRRLIDAAFRRLLRVPFISGSNYPMLLFSSHVGGRRGNYVLALALLALVGVSALRMDSVQTLWRKTGAGLLAQGDAGHSLDPRRYADQRERLGIRLPAVHIPSERITDDWLRVYIPFRTDVDSDAMRRLCPALAMQDAPPDAEAVLACLPQRFRLTLDGAAPARAPDFAFALEAEGRPRGIVAMIDVQPLPRGRHELGLSLADARDADAADDAKPPAPLRIPFWR